MAARGRPGSSGAEPSTNVRSTPAARRIGLLAADTGHHDVVDGHIAALSRAAKTRVLTSDPDDLFGWGVPRDSILVC